MCLDEGRFVVWVEWTDGEGRSGLAHAVPLTRDSGYFWFLEPGNVELAVKALNGCGVNDRRWFFAAGLTNLGVTVHVTDLTAGRTRAYVNPPGTPFAPIADTAAFESCSGEVGAANPEEPPEDVLPPAARRRAVRAAGSCEPEKTALCLAGGRYRIEVFWETASGRSGVARAVSLTAESGYFWFFDPSNVEIVAKVLDACGIGKGEWFFSAGLTSVGVRIRVTDTLTGDTREYAKPIGSLFDPILDTGAFSFCPTATPSPPPAGLATATPTDTPTPGGVFLTATPRRTVSISPSRTLTPSPTASRTASPPPSRTASPIVTDPTPTRTPSAPVSPSRTPTRTPTRTPSSTKTPLPPSPDASATPTRTASRTPTRTPTATQTPTVTPGPGHVVGVVHRGFPFYGFLPGTLHVQVGDTVHWNLRDVFDGSLHATRALDGSWDSGPPGPSFEYTFTTTGEFAYECGYDIHSQGLIVVDP